MVGIAIVVIFSGYAARVIRVTQRVPYVEQDLLTLL